MTLFRTVLACMLLFASWGVSAKSIDCTNCTTTQRITKAKQAGPGIHYVYDLASGASFKVTVTQVCEVQWDGRNLCWLETWFETPEPQASSFFARVAMGSATPLYTVNGAQFPGDAYELVQFPQLATNVGTWVKETGPGYAQDFANFVHGVVGLIGLDSNVEMTLRVHMPDGSSALYVYDHVAQTWKYVPGTAMDSDGNIVPQTRDDVAGGSGGGSTIVYTFTNTNNWSNFVVRVENMGVPISGTVTVGPVITVTCSQTLSGIVCRTQQQ